MNSGKNTRGGKQWEYEGGRERSLVSDFPDMDPLVLGAGDDAGAVRGKASCKYKVLMANQCANGLLFPHVPQLERVVEGAGDEDIAVAGAKVDAVDNVGMAIGQGRHWGEGHALALNVPYHDAAIDDSLCA